MVDFARIAKKSIKKSINMIDFGALAKICTPRAPWMKGLLPPLKTLAALFLVSLVASTAMWGGAALFASATAFLPVLAKTAVTLLGVALANFWFHRDFTYGMLSIRNEQEFQYDHYNITDLRKLVNHVRKELSIHYGKKIPMPRLGTFNKNSKMKIIAIPGRNAANSALYFSSGTFESRLTRQDQRTLAAEIQAKLAMFYKVRGWSEFFVRLGTDLLMTLENMQSGPLFFKMVGFLATPVHILLLIQRSIIRSYEYEAAQTVVDCGRGPDLYNATHREVCPTQISNPTAKQLNGLIDKNKRKRYKKEGYFSGFMRPLTDWVIKNELYGEGKNSYLLTSVLDICVREITTFFKELNGGNRSTNKKKDLGDKMPEYGIAKNEAELKKLINMTTQERKAFKQEDRKKKKQERIYPKIFPKGKKALSQREKNEILYRKMHKKDRYAPISPDGNGIVPPQVAQQAQVPPPANIFEPNDEVAAPILHRKPSRKRRHSFSHPPAAQVVLGEVPRRSLRLAGRNR